MYYKIRNNILFRAYHSYGYITDNSEFGYRGSFDAGRFPGERYVSKSGAVMLSVLRKFPQHIDDIVDALTQIFTDVERYVLKRDTEEFFQQLAGEGYLYFARTEDACREQKDIMSSDTSGDAPVGISFGLENCAKELFRPGDFLRSIHIEVASACNERCVHCYIPHSYKTTTINSELFYKILDEGREMNIVNVTLSGGEPLLHKDFVEFLVRCRELDLSVNVLSNLTLLTPDIVAEMKKNPLLCVQTSLYSMDPSVHDSITGLAGSFEKTVDGVMQIRAAGIPLQISCPVMKQNLGSFLEVIEWGRARGIDVAIEPVIFAAYDGSCSNLKNRLSLKEIGEAVEKQLPAGYADSIYEIAQEKEALTPDSPICSICRYNFCVSAEGEAFPCVGWQNHIIGDLKQQSIREIWEGSKEIFRLRQIKRKDFPKCVECRDRGYCTVCMMSNSNETPGGDAFKIDSFHCKVASVIHSKVDAYRRKCSTSEGGSSQM